MTDHTDLIKRLEIMSAMINLGERISWGQDTALMDEAAAALRAETARADLWKAAAMELREALDACVASLERADTAVGVCCCGDDMDTHSDPMHCGHAPVDMGDYYAHKAIEASHTALARFDTLKGATE